MGECCRRFTAAVTARRMSCSSSLLISSTIFLIKARTLSLLRLGICSLRSRMVEARFTSGSRPSSSSGSKISCLRPHRSMASPWMTFTRSLSKKLRTSPSHLVIWGLEGPRPAPPEAVPKPPLSARL